MHSVERDSGRRMKSSFSSRKCHSHCLMMILCGSFFRKVHDAELSMYLKRWREERCVLTKYELTGVRNQNAEITGVKHGSFINLIFPDRLVIHFDHQNSGLHSFTKCNSLKSTICIFKSSHYLENHTGVW